MGCANRSLARFDALSKPTQTQDFLAAAKKIRSERSSLYGSQSDLLYYLDLGLLYQALASRKVDMIAANSTDGPASVLDVKVLEDDKHYFPPYDCAVVIREDALGRYPGLREALEALSGKITAETMRKLNQRVDGDKRPAADVAREFLATIQ